MSRSSRSGPLRERSAEEEYAKPAGLTGGGYDAQRRRWREGSETVQAALTGHAEATESNREQPI
ncbi:hypothetical protein GCM10010300_52350 [Streptomyces olivaceoviridis]|nr:hypothetical protein GCM10010300_52350 [Streptomyces olivaceoviridis]